LYAAISYSCKDSQHTKEDSQHAKVATNLLAVESLKRAINDPDCELERPSDWISTDPDFGSLKSSKEFQDFLRDRILRDYPQQTLQLAVRSK